MLSLHEHVLLLEYDHEKTWAKHGEKIYDRMVDSENYARDYDGKPNHYIEPHFKRRVEEADPTPHQEYSQWIARHYANGGIQRIEDLASRVRPALERFHDAKKKKLLQKHGINPDINQHRGLSGLEDAVEKLPAPEPKEDPHPEPHEYEKHENEHWTHVVPKTQNAACYYGRGTRWCTAATQGQNMFKYYHEDDDPLHIFIPKKAEYPGEKYQLHVGSAQLMNEKDDGVGWGDNPFDHRPAPISARRAVISSLKKDAHIHMHPNTDELHFQDRDVHDIASRILEPHDYHELARSDHAALRHMAAYSGDREDVEHLEHDPNYTVRAALAHRGFPDITHRLILDPHDEVADAATATMERMKKRL